MFLLHEYVILSYLFERYQWHLKKFLSVCLLMLDSSIYWFLCFSSIMLAFLKYLLILGCCTCKNSVNQSIKYYFCLQDVFLWPQRGKTAQRGRLIVHLLSIGGPSSSRVFLSPLRLWPKFIISVPPRGHLYLLPGIIVGLLFQCLCTQPTTLTVLRGSWSTTIITFFQVFSWICFELTLFL